MPSFIRRVYAATSQFGSAFLAVFALLLSLYNLYDAKRTQDQVFRTDALKIEYGIYTDLVKLEHDNPFQSHLFSASPAAYFSRSQQIKAALRELVPKERTKLLLEERSIAHYAFTVYEETFYQWQSARQGNNDTLAQLLLNNLTFFDDFLCNSRLIWYWDNPSDPLYKQFSDPLVAYYNQNVKSDCRASADPLGPLAAS